MPLPFSVLLRPPDEAFHRRVSEAFPDCEVHRFESWDQVASSIAASSAIPVVIGDPMMDSSEDALDSGCRAALLGHAEISFLVAVDTQTISPSALIQLGQWGVSDVICARQASSKQIRRVVLANHSVPVARLFERFRARTSPRGWRILSGAAMIGAGGGTVPELAHELLTGERTLARHCHIEGLPTPRRLLAWVRVLKAVHLLQNPGRSVSHVAYAAGYSNESGLRRACYDLLGESPRQLRSPEALSQAVRTFETEVLSTPADVWG
jgi:AraC-like DNA-binding protein